MKKTIVLFLYFFVNTALAGSNIGQYLKEFSELEKVEQAHLNSLNFQIDPNLSIKSNISYKLNLVDQHGNQWLFKAGAFSSKDGAVAIYRIYNFLGIETPETYPYTLNINGEIVDGSIQRIYKVNKESQVSNLYFYNKETINYIAMNFFMSWATLNHHVHLGQFIKPFTPYKELEILRIDNSINWFLIDNDQLNIRYISPTLSHVTEAGYTNFWLSLVLMHQSDLVRNYLNTFNGSDFLVMAVTNQEEEIKNKQQLVDFEKINQTMLLYSLTPDNFIESMLKSAIDNKLLYLPNSIPTQIVYKFPELVFQKNSIAFDHQLFLKKFIKRKNNSSFESRRLLNEMKPWFNYSKKLDDKISPQFLSTLSSRLKEKKLWINSFKNFQVKSESSKVVVPISFKLYNAIMPLFSLANLKVYEHRAHLIDQVVKNLIQIKISDEYQSEAKARENAVKYLNELKKKIKEVNDFNSIFNSFMHYQKIFSPLES